MAYLNKFLFALIAWTLIAGSAGAGENRRETPPEEPENPDNPAVLAALAVKYEHAEGVPRDYARAADLYCRAARSGHADAQYALGWMYANGRGVSRDDGVAAQLFAMADGRGHVHAREMLRHIRPSAPAPLPPCLLPDEPATGSEELEEAPLPVDETVYLKGPIYNLVHKLAPGYEVDPQLVLAVISVESGFNARAISPKNAQGLMQLIPETAQRFRVKNTFDPSDNIKGGLAYLQWLLAFFKGNVPLVAAAYNAGEKAVEKHRGIPPYPETQDYVRKIIHLYKKTTHPYRRNLVEAPSFTVLPASYRK
ncbi:MAG: lytic transglycosylase [Gallionella sp.]|nr:MAG: lytic transglycosylase [Gallionella sp.]